MKVKTSELTGHALDWAVAKCEGFTSEYDADEKDYWINRTNHAAQFLPPFGYLRDVFYPSTDWSQGGPIIERHCINLFRLDPKTEEDNRFWLAHVDGIYCRYGVSVLIAAMRCYVAIKLGEEVEIPEGLIK